MLTIHQYNVLTDTLLAMLAAGIIDQELYNYWLDQFQTLVERA